MANEQAPRDENSVPSLLLIDDVTGDTIPAACDSDGNLLVVASLTDVTVPDGGTGRTSFTAYAPIFGGTTSTGALQSGTVGNSGEVLTSNGAGMLPTFQAPAAAGANTALSNLASVAINSALIPGTAGALDFGSTTKPWADIWFAGTSVTPGTNQFKITGASTSGVRTITAPDASGTMTLLGNTSTGSGSVVLATSPALTTPNIGAATATSINGLTITASTGTLTIANGKTFTASNTLAFTGTDGSSVAFGTGGTVAYTDVTTLSSLASIGTITTGVWNATDIPLSAGGTGATLSDPNADRIMFWDDSAGQVTWLTAGTGLTITDTTISASSSSTPRRNLNIQLNTTSAQTSGDTNPTDTTATNGVSCSTNVSGGNSALKINVQTVATWDFYDKDPEFNFSMNYSGGSATGTGIVWFGDTADQLPPTRTQVNKGIFVAVVTTAGTSAWYAVNADGSTNTNTELVGLTSAQQNQWRVVMDSGTNIKFYCNYTLVATHTTNLPSGDFAATSWLEMGVDNGAADSTTRTCTFGYVDVLIDSPTG